AHAFDLAIATVLWWELAAERHGEVDMLGRDYPAQRQPALSAGAGAPAGRHHAPRAAKSSVQRVYWPSRLWPPALSGSSAERARRFSRPCKDRTSAANGEITEGWPSGLRLSS